MLKTNIKYIGKRTGFLAHFFVVSRKFGKFNTIEEASDKFNNWIKLFNNKDWVLEFE